MKKIKLPIIIAVIAVLLLVGGAWSSRRLESAGGNDIVAQNGLHRHATLALFVDGAKQEIPPNVGLVGAHQPMHTHDPDNVIHMEMSGEVRNKDLMLSEFFRVWGKPMESFGALERMTVNGKENMELGSYIMEDGDKIELRFSGASSSSAQNASSTSAVPNNG